MLRIKHQRSPTRTLGPPIPKPSWKSKAQNLDQNNDLLGKIEYLKKKGLTGATVMMNWVIRRIQPLQHRVNPKFSYVGEGDPGRLTTDLITSPDALRQVGRVLDGVTGEPKCIKDFRLNKRPREVSIK